MLHVTIPIDAIDATIPNNAIFFKTKKHISFKREIS